MTKHLNTNSVCAFIGLGSNLDSPLEQIKQALLALQKLDHCQSIKQSKIYISKPMGPQNQGDYLNAVLELQTSLSAIELLHQLQKIELSQGRIRNEKWGARTLDLDLLLYNDLIMETTELTLPHNGLKHRSFVIYPLMDVAPELILPDGTTLVELFNCCSNTDLEVYRYD